MSEARKSTSPSTSLSRHARCLYLGLLAVISSSALAADVSISLHGQVQPGLYGAVTVGDHSPTVIYREPVRVYHEPVYVERHYSAGHYAPVVVHPIVIHAPKKHRKHWKKHCHQYHACGRQVRFVEVYEQPRHYSRESYGYDGRRYEGREERRHYEYDDDHDDD